VRALLDSSVLIAASLLEDVLMDHELITSEFIVGELARKLDEKFHFPAEEIAEVRNAVLAAAECVAPVEVPADACRDPNDLPVLGTAVAGRADILVTGDKDLLALETFEGVSIIRPGDFWRKIEVSIVFGHS
jgi:putative PIN family toxin of toxin-antitoxin system